MSCLQVKKNLRLSYEEYRSMANVFVHELRKREADAAEQEEAGSESTERSESSSKSSQMTKSELLNWYCQEIEKDVESQDEMIERRQIAEKVREKNKSPRDFFHSLKYRFLLRSLTVWPSRTTS